MGLPKSLSPATAGRQLPVTETGPLYHGTTEERARRILAGGFQGGEGRHAGVVHLAPTPELAHSYAEGRVQADGGGTPAVLRIDKVRGVSAAETAYGSPEKNRDAGAHYMDKGAEVLVLDPSAIHGVSRYSRQHTAAGTAPGGVGPITYSHSVDASGRFHQFDAHNEAGRNIGRATAEEKPDHVSLDTVDVHHSAQGYGIGSRLLDNVIAHFPGRELRLKPEPFGWPEDQRLDENQLRNWYGSRGFEDSGNTQHMVRHATRYAPSSGIFAPTTGLDRRLFTGQAELRPEVRGAIMERLDRCIRVDIQLAGSDWQDWMKVYIAGGSASEWAGGRPNDAAQDLDVLVGIDLKKAQGYNAFEGMDAGQAATALNAAFRAAFNETAAELPGVDGTWDVTAYCNPAIGTDIAAIRPYAAWDVSDSRWAVKPPHLPEHSLKDFDPAVLSIARAVATEARAILRLPEPQRSREAKALWERIHQARSQAFSAEGTGWTDIGNVTEKWLAYAPHDILGKIRELALTKTATAADGTDVWWHGTPDERTWQTGASYGIHVGTEEAARQALHARIGRPAEGEWDGTREYGKTLLNRDQRSHVFDPDTRTWTEHVEHHPPSYPTGGAGYSDGGKIPLDARPNVFPVRIKGPMTNTVHAPHEDFHANGYMRGQLKRGRAKSGYYYTNVSEDEGSISAVVPSAAHLERVERQPRTAALDDDDEEGYEQNLYGPKQFYHGTATPLSPGDLLTPGSHESHHNTASHVYMTNERARADRYAWDALKHPRSYDQRRGTTDDGESPRTYVVEATGHVEGDPHDTSGVAWRTPDPVRVVREVRHGAGIPGVFEDWVSPPKTAAADPAADSQGYWINHRPPGPGATNHDGTLKERGESIPYHQVARRDPEDLVDIYRAVPRNQVGINPGDWISLHRDWVQERADTLGPDHHVVHARVPAGHVWLDASERDDDEAGYHGPPTAPEPKTAAASHLVLYHGAHHEDVPSITASGLRPSDTASGWTVTDDPTGAAIHAQKKDWTAPRVVEFHVPAGQEAEYLGEPSDAAEGTVYALQRPLPAEWVHQVHDVPPSWVRQGVIERPPMEIREWEGRTGDKSHITRSDRGALPVAAIANMPGADGEVPGEHRNYHGPEWEAFKDWYSRHAADHPVFVTVDHGEQPKLSEGNHRRDAAVELGWSHIPAEVRYFGNAQQEGTVEERARRRTAGAPSQPWMQWAAGDRPHQAVIWHAQTSTRRDHPELTEPLDDSDPYWGRITQRPSEPATRLLQGALAATGHPADLTARAWAMRHANPDWGQSQVAELDGNIGVVLHPDRWDKGTLAHEGAHMRQAHDSGRDLFAPAPDEVKHGPDFARHYAQMLDAIAPGSGETFRRHHAEAMQLVGNYRHRVHGLPKLVSEAAWKSDGPWYHGSPAELQPGDLIEPDKYPPTMPDPDVRGDDARKPRDHVYFSSRQQYITEHYGPNVYEVEPTGPDAHDPEYSHRQMRRSKHPLRVVRKVSGDWGAALPTKQAVSLEPAADAPTIVATGVAGGPYFHGTKQMLDPGDQVIPDHPSATSKGTSGWVYATPHASMAYLVAAGKPHEGTPRVYEVAATGKLQHDPEMDEGSSFRSKAPLRVVRELPRDEIHSAMTERWGPDAADKYLGSREAASGYDGLTSRSAMIYLDLPEGTVRQEPGGVDDHHITLVYLGSDVSDEAFAEACRRAQQAAAQSYPLRGVLRGVDMFPPSDSSGGKVPAFVPAYVPGIGKLRRLLEDLSASEHRHYKPHVTFGYYAPDEPLPEPHPPVQVSFGRLHVKRGDDVVSYPLGEPIRAESAVTGSYEDATDEGRALRRQRVERWLNERGGRNREGTMPIPGKWAPIANNQWIHGVIQDHSDGHFPDEHWEHLPDQDVSLRQKIHEHQGFVYPEGVREKIRESHEEDDPWAEDFRDEPGGSDPKFLRHEGETYLLDGHHRFAEARLMGYSSMTGKVFDTANPEHKPSNCYECHSKDVEHDYDHDSEECPTCQHHGWYV